MSGFGRRLVVAARALAASWRRFVAAVGRGVGPVVEGVSHWPASRWPVPTVIVLLLAATVLVFGVEQLEPSGWPFETTVSVRARTEFVELELIAAQENGWWLPPGRYTVLGDRPAAETCAAHQTPGSPFTDWVCTFADWTAIVIEQGGTIELTARPDPAGGKPKLLLTALPNATSRFEVRGVDPETQAVTTRLTTSDLLTFESDPLDVWRIPLEIARAQIGDLLPDSVVSADAIGPIDQPILTEGDVRLYARNFPLNDRFQVLEERLAAADVVQVPAPGSAAGATLNGIVSLAAASADDRDVFDLTLHTRYTDVFVRRPRGGDYRIGASMWLVASNLPVWLAIWAVLISFVVFANYHSDRMGELRGHYESQKKH